LAKAENADPTVASERIETAGLRIDIERLMARIEALAEINRQGDGSCCRLALTQADRRGRDLVVEWMTSAGLEVRVDRIGNIIGGTSGADDLAPVMTGSHIDTVATGGRFDGVLGVVAGLEVLQTLREAGVATARPMAVAVFTNEEGVRYQPDMMGSLVFAGGLDLDEALATRGDDGTVLGAELERIGYAGQAQCGAPRPWAYVELHIEQGPVLDRQGEVLGAVEDLQGISWQEVIFRGVSNHAGTTPMNLRRDAGVCAAEVATFVRDLARRMGRSQVATVGRIQFSPNLVNVIPREARMSIDLRNTDDALLREAEAELADFVQAVAAREEVSVEVRRLVRTEPVRFDERVVSLIEQVCADLGHPARRMTSGAGHDAQMVAQIAPAAMIFVPSIGGISHNPREDTRVEHLEVGANVLLHTMLRLADGPV
jgi:N-carbamoyl-L-amino-acid hydrolase